MITRVGVTNFLKGNFIDGKIAKPDERRRVSYLSTNERDLEWGEFKARLDEKVGQGQWTHIVIRPLYSGVNIK